MVLYTVQVKQTACDGASACHDRSPVQFLIMKFIGPISGSVLSSESGSDSSLSSKFLLD
jgi:hypothetical protein